MQYFAVPSPLGALTIGCDEGFCQCLAFGGAGVGPAPLPPAAARMGQWLAAYFAGHKPNPADAPIKYAGTPFQTAVWEILLTIPWGERLCYGDVSRLLTGRADSSRAVGQAIGANPLAVVIPCHRIVGKHGLGGYAWGIEIKKKLLNFESLGII